PSPHPSTVKKTYGRIKNECANVFFAGETIGRVPALRHVGLFISSHLTPPPPPRLTSAIRITNPDLWNR
ncbi:hypothetical protein KUCAC02_004246, partial [Chaenocephalus aceratus]